MLLYPGRQTFDIAARTASIQPERYAKLGLNLFGNNETKVVDKIIFINIILQ
jgi:hypothetical protein